MGRLSAIKVQLEFESFCENTCVSKNKKLFVCSSGFFK